MMTTKLMMTLSDRAARQILSLMADEKDQTLMLRISVIGGGCSGFQYKFDLEHDIQADDRVFENGQARLVVDEMSLGFLDQAEIDYVEELMGASFKINNPNATASCGCGTSFST